MVPCMPAGSQWQSVLYDRKILPVNQCELNESGISSLRNLAPRRKLHSLHMPCPIGFIVPCIINEPQFNEVVHPSVFLLRAQHTQKHSYHTNRQCRQPFFLSWLYWAVRYRQNRRDIRTVAPPAIVGDRQRTCLAGQGRIWKFSFMPVKKRSYSLPYLCRIPRSDVKQLVTVKSVESSLLGQVTCISSHTRFLINFSES